MSAVNTGITLDGLFKEVYSDKIKDLVPSAVKLVNMVPFKLADKQLGLRYNQPVLLGLENGITYGGSDGEAFTLNSSVAVPMKNAEVKGHEMVLRSQMSVGAASRAASGKNAFENATKLLVGNMLKSMYHRLEIQLMYGQSGIGIVEAISGGTNEICKVEDHEWAPAIWNGSKGAVIQFYDATGVTLRGAAAVVSVDYATKQITFDSDLTALGVVATDKMFFEGANGKEFIGLHEIATKSGTLFGIDNTAYDLFKGNIVDVGTDFAGGEAVLSFAKIEESIAAAMDKGLGEEEVSVMVSTRSWNNLLTDLAAKRQYDGSYSNAQLENGAKSIKFHGMNGTIKIIPSTFVKEGYAYAICEKELHRVGSSDITFEIPGYEGKIFRLLENSNGFELRAYTDQAIFCSRPATITLLRYIKSDQPIP
jgi:hypothetical protein